MKKCLLLALLLVSSSVAVLRAQSSYFELESDTVCVGQQVHIRPTTMNAGSYYWGFCSGYLNNNPVLADLGAGFGFVNPSSIVVDKDGDNYYGFVTNGATTELLRLEFGNSLQNIPTVTNFGSLDATVCPSPNSIFLTKDSGKWYLFMCGGGGTTASTISRFDFGAHLYNQPNGTRMGNVGGLLNDPRGIFVAKQGDLYYGFVVNAGNNRLIRLNFGNNISRTPSQTLVTPITSGFGGAAISNPRDITPVYDAGNWYLFVTCQSNPFSTIERLYFANTLTNTPVITLAAGGVNNTRVRQPTSVAIVKDCGGWAAYITNNIGITTAGIDEVVRYNVPDLNTTWSFGAAYSSGTGGGTFDDPTDISSFIRYRDTLFTFVTNFGTGRLSRISFPQCTNSSIPSSTLAQPPAYSYNAPGLYNIYLALDEGKPNMRTDCKQIRVLPVPPLNVSRDTLLCQGDTLRITAASQLAIQYNFSPDYNINAVTGDNAGPNIYVYPQRPTTYDIQFVYANGCKVDTLVKVDVSSVKGDAGPDRTIPDGSSTVLGGPGTFTGPQYIYQWFPAQYIDNIYSLNPTVNPPNDLTYYLKTTNQDRCSAIDTVNVHVTCSDLNLPNAFEPDNGRGAPRFFGILNKQIVQLNYFRIFDRWGKLMFETADATKEWDGNYGGNPAPFGVYVWVADGFCRSGERISKTGNVTLIR